MKATLVKITQEAKNISSFWFKPENNIRYVAGQFTELSFKLEKSDERGNKRWFTISSSPTEDLFSITTHLDTDKPSSFKKRLFSLKPGHVVNYTDPMGDFVLPQKKNTPLVFIAGGIGITPMRSMIKWLVDKDETRDLHLYYAAKTLEDVAFRKLFEQAPIDFDIILDEPKEHWNGVTGRLTSETIMKLPGVMQDALVYISGPEPMVETFYSELRSNGVAEHRLVMDYFPGYREY